MGCERILSARPAVRRRPTGSAERRNVFGGERRNSLLRDGCVEGSDFGDRHVESGAVPEQPEIITANGHVGMGREREEVKREERGVWSRVREREKQES
jgi:hypothetical protein